MILLDVNVVVAAFRDDHARHAVARPWLAALVAGAESFAVPDVVWSSFLRIVTHRRIFTVPASLDEAFAFVRAVGEQPGYVSVTPGRGHLAVFEQLCREADVTGDLVPDAFLAALAVAQGCALASFDRDFARFDGLDWRLPG